MGGQIAWHCTYLLVCCRTFNNLNENYAHDVSIMSTMSPNNWFNQRNHFKNYRYNSGLRRHAESSIVSKVVSMKQCTCVSFNQRNPFKKITVIISVYCGEFHSWLNETVHLLWPSLVINIFGLLKDLKDCVWKNL